MIDAAPLESVLITDELTTRPARAPELARENAALLQLVDEMGHLSRHVLQRLVEIVLDLCHSGSAGVSILEGDEGKPRFRWHAVAGALREQVWGITPRDFSTSGVVLERNAVQLFRYPERRFRYLAEFKPRIIELLVVPLVVRGATVGTVWVATHDEQTRFDGEDARLISHLARVAGAADQVRDALEQLRVASRHKDEFLGVLSHEMRNPLAAMSNSIRYLDAAASTNPDEARARAVIQRQLAQITRLSEDLLDVSRIGSGALELRKEPTDLVNAVRLGREAALPSLVEYDREIVVTVPDTPMLVDGDPVRLTQIVSNLLTNAARRTRSGGRATLTLRAEGSEAVLTVSSETEGIAAGWVPHLPKAGAAAARPERFGIGLELARSLTAMHGGTATTVNVGSGRENGFEVRFALLEPTASAVEPADRRRDHARVREPRRRERVLIIDDCVDSSDSLAMLLQSWGHDVRTAQGANAGLRIEWEFEPHAVILDIEMPGKNGYEVAAELRVRRRRELLLVALSGHAREEDRARSLGAGFDHHLTKPANVEMLRRLLS